MSAHVPIELPSAERSRQTATSDRKPLWIALGLTAALTALRLVDTVDSDVAWQLWIAQRIHHGATLYRDIIEINPPLWFWMAIPVERIATLFELRIEAVLIVANGAIAALALAATDRLLPDLAPRPRAWFLAYAALTLIAMPWMHVGQREQLALIATLPYCALAAARFDRRRVEPLLAGLVGTGAALAFALKHYFLIVPAVLELWLLASLLRQWRPVRPETAAMIAVGALYLAAIFAFARPFLTDIVPMVRLAYGSTGLVGLGALFRPYLVVGLIILGCVVARRALIGRDLRAPLTSALTLAAFAFTAIYFIQAKGWLYHAIPLLGCASLAFAALMAERPGGHPSLRTLAPVLLSLPLLLALTDERNPALPNADLNRALAGTRAGETIGFLSVETEVPWSVTLQRGFRYPSRNMGYWMVHAVLRNEKAGSPDPRLTELGSHAIRDTISDYLCTPPRRIIVTRPRPDEAGFDILTYFERDPAFARLMTHYKAVSRTTFEVYDLASPLPAPAAGSCRRGT